MIPLSPALRGRSATPSIEAQSIAGMEAMPPLHHRRGN
jgi:hypothetical protein